MNTPVTDVTHFKMTNVRVPVDLHAAFAGIARRNHRTVSAEIRKLMTEHVAREQADEEAVPA